MLVLKPFLIIILSNILHPFSNEKTNNFGERIPKQAKQ
jgi:hypothetical protein